MTKAARGSILVAASFLVVVAAISCRVSAQDECGCDQQCNEDTTHGFRSSSPSSNFWRVYSEATAETTWMVNSGTGGTRVPGVGSFLQWEGTNGSFVCTDSDCTAYNEANCSTGDYLGEVAKWTCQSGS